jgi:hypothetical protein
MAAWSLSACKRDLSAVNMNICYSRFFSTRYTWRRKINISSSFPEFLGKKNFGPKFFFVLRLSLKLWIRHFACMANNRCSWINS